MRTDRVTSDYHAMTVLALRAGWTDGGVDGLGLAWGPAAAADTPARRAFWRTDEVVSYLPPRDLAGARAMSDAGRLARTRALMALQRELEAYTRLPADWDGYGGRPASTAMVADALAFLAHLPAAAAVPKPMLTGGGVIGLYWELKRAAGAAYASLEFDGLGHYTYLTEAATDAGGDGGEEDVPVDRCAVGLARWLLTA